MKDRKHLAGSSQISRSIHDVYKAETNSLENDV